MYACKCAVFLLSLIENLVNSLRARVDNKGKEESVERTIWPVQDVFGMSRARNSNIDQSERSI